MSPEKCEKCGATVSDDASVCPACGAAIPPVARTSLPAPKSNARKFPFLAIAILVMCVLAVFLFAISKASRPPTASKREVAEATDLEGTRTKAERGDADAQKNLGRIYAKGESVKRDYKEAAKWYRQAADQGLAAAQAALGELYEAGQGVPKDYTEAAKWYRRAAEQGDVKGQYSLAVLYVVGNGVPQDSNEAMKWYRQAADQGDELAQYNLGMRYYEGSGVKADPVEAYYWLSLAADRGVQDAANTRAELKRKMTGEQIAEGRRRAEAFVIKKPAPPAK